MKEQVIIVSPSETATTKSTKVKKKRKNYVQSAHLLSKPFHQQNVTETDHGIIIVDTGDETNVQFDSLKPEEEHFSCNQVQCQPCTLASTFLSI